MDRAWLLFAPSFYGHFRDGTQTQPTPLPGQVVRFIVGIAGALHITVVEIAPIEHDEWSHAGILYRRPAEELADVLKDTRPVSMSEHPDARIYSIRDLLLEQANERQDSEAWLDFEGKQSARREKGASVGKGFGSSHGVGGDAAYADECADEEDEVGANTTFTIPTSHVFDFSLPSS